MKFGKVPDTSSMVANMMGLGPLMAGVQDPAFLAQVKALFDAIADTRARTERIEAKLDAFIRRITAASGSAELGTVGTGACAAASGPAHDGVSDTQAASGSDRTRPGPAGDGATGSVL